eukprot:556565-Amphidinium_carterae.1
MDERKLRAAHDFAVFAIEPDGVSVDAHRVGRMILLPTFADISIESDIDGLDLVCNHVLRRL